MKCGKSILAVVSFLIISGFVDSLSYNGNIPSHSTFSHDGKILYVGGDGPDNYTRIQDAINNASDGDGFRL